MIRTRVASVTLAFAFVACARSPQANTTPEPAAPPAAATTPASALEPVGTYTFSTNFQGRAMAGTFVISRNADGKLGGTIYADAGSVPIEQVAVEGRIMRMRAYLPDGSEILFALEFQGDTYAGNWTTQGTSGSITGARSRS